MNFKKNKKIILESSNYSIISLYIDVVSYINLPQLCIHEGYMKKIDFENIDTHYP